MTYFGAQKALHLILLLIIILENSNGNILKLTLYSQVFYAEILGNEDEKEADPALKDLTA